MEAREEEEGTKGAGGEAAKKRAESSEYELLSLASRSTAYLEVKR